MGSTGPSKYCLRSSRSRGPLRSPRFPVLVANAARSLPAIGTAFRWAERDAGPAFTPAAGALGVSLAGFRAIGAPEKLASARARRLARTARRAAEPDMTTDVTHLSFLAFQGRSRAIACAVRGASITTAIGVAPTDPGATGPRWVRP